MDENQRKWLVFIGYIQAHLGQQCGSITWTWPTAPSGAIMGDEPPKAAADCQPPHCHLIKDETKKNQLGFT